MHWHARDTTDLKQKSCLHNVLAADGGLKYLKPGLQSLLRTGQRDAASV